MLNELEIRELYEIFYIIYLPIQKVTIHHLLFINTYLA